jgi:hypothetical protein
MVSDVATSENDWPFIISTKIRCLLQNFKRILGDRPGNMEDSLAKLAQSGLLERLGLMAWSQKLVVQEAGADGYYAEGADDGTALGPDDGDADLSFKSSPEVTGTSR